MIFVTGDTHRHDLARFEAFCRKQSGLTKEDFVIVAGDFGGVWSEKTLESDLRPFSELPFTLLFVDGNHENFDLLNAFPVETWMGGKIHRIGDDVLHLMRGQVFTLGGKSIFTFGGATSRDRARRIEGLTWWPQELPSGEEFDEGIANLARHGDRVDFVISHSCSERALMYLVSKRLCPSFALYPENGMLSAFEDRISFGHWYFGHYHVDAELGGRYTALLHEVIQIG